MSIFPLVLFVTAFLLTLVRSDYTIDDSNYSILKFSENPGGPVWGPFGSDTGEVLLIRLPNGTMQTVDATQCFGGTYTYAACSASNNCNVQFSFTGSGITVYVLRAGPQGMSASLTIDSGSATTATLDVPPAPQYYIPRQVLFNVQNLVSGTHSAVMTVQDWNGGFSGMMLDYINVNQASVSGPTTSAPSNPSASPTTNPQSGTSSNPQSTGSSTGTHSGSASSAAVVSVFSSQSGGTASPSGTPSGNGTGSTVSPSSSPQNSHIAPIVGGAVGGSVGLLALAALALLCYRRRRQQVLAANDRPSPLLPQQAEARFTTLGGGGSDPFASSAALSASRGGASRPLQSWTETEGSTHNLTVGDASSTTSPITNLSHARMTSSGNDSATSSVPVSAGAGAAAAAAVAAIAQQRAAAASNQSTAGAPVTPVIYPNEKMVPSSSGALQQSNAAEPDASDAQLNPVLTDNQADFVNSLFNNNVPAPVVARVLERMLANPQGANTTGYNDPELRPHLGSGTNAPWRSTLSDIGDGETAIGTAPPSYDYVRAQ